MIARITSIAKKNVFLKNFSVLTLSSVLTQFLTMIIGIKIARILSPFNFGLYNLLQLHVIIFTVIATLGIRRVIIRNIARDKTNVEGLLKSSLSIRVIGLIIAVTAFIVYYNFFDSYDIFLFGLVILSLIMMVSFDYFDSLAFGLEKMELSCFVNVLSTICWILAILLFPDEYLDITIIFIIFTSYTILKTLLFFIIIRVKTNYRIKRNTSVDNNNRVSKLVTDSLPFYYLDLFTLLSMQIPILFLEFRSGTEEIGYFNIASKVLLPITLIVNTALSAIFPIMARLYSHNFLRFITIIKLMFIAIGLFGIGGAFAVTLFREEIVLLLYGEKYLSSSLVLSYQCWYVAFFAIVCLIGTILGAIDRQKELSYLSFVCTLIQVPLLWFGSKFGAQYLSAAFLIATVINLILHFFVINKFVKEKIPISFYLKISILMALGYFISLQISPEIDLIYKFLFLILCIVGGSIFLYTRYGNTLKETFAK